MRRHGETGLITGEPFTQLPTPQTTADPSAYVKEVQSWHRSLLTTLDFLLKHQRGGNDLLIADPVSGEPWSLRETVAGLRAELPRVQALGAQGAARRPRAASYTEFYRTLLDDVTRPLTGALMDPQLTPQRRAQTTQAISELYTQFGRELVLHRLLGEDHNSAERRLKAGFIGSPAHQALEARVNALGREFAAEMAAGRQRNPYGTSNKGDIAVTRQLDDLVMQLALGPPRSAAAFFAEASPLRADGTRAAVHFVGIAQSGATTAAIVAQLARRFGWGSEIPGHLGYLIPSKRESGAESRATEFVSTLDAQQIAPGDTVVLIDNTLVSGGSAQTALRALEALHGPGRVNAILAVAYPRNKTSIEAGTRSIPVWGLLDGRQVFAPDPNPSSDDAKQRNRAPIATEGHEPLEPGRGRPRAEDFVPSDGSLPQGDTPNGLRAAWASNVTHGVNTIAQARDVHFRELAAYYRSGVNPALANRRAFLDGLLEDTMPVVEFIEIPGVLKPINDHVGHVAADKLLAEVLDTAADVARQHPGITVYQLDALRLAVEGSKRDTTAFADAFEARMKHLELSYVAGDVRYANRAGDDAADPLVREGLPVVRAQLGAAAAGSRKELLARGVDALDRASERLKRPEQDGGTAELDPERGAHLRKLKQAPALGEAEPLWVNDPRPGPRPSAQGRRAPRDAAVERRHARRAASANRSRHRRRPGATAGRQARHRRAGVQGLQHRRVLRPPPRQPVGLRSRRARAHEARHPHRARLCRCRRGGRDQPRAQPLRRRTWC